MKEIVSATREKMHCDSFYSEGENARLFPASPASAADDGGTRFRFPVPLVPHSAGLPLIAPRARATEPEPAAGEIETQCRKIAEAIHLTRPIAEVDRVQVRQWLRDKLSFDWHVMPAVAAVAAREIDRGRSISGFRYLDGAVRDYAGEWQREHDRLQAIAGGGR